MGVYVHFPWCARLCPYCDFNVHLAPEPPHARFADAVLAELGARAPDFAGRRLVSIFLGGGTPSMWDPAEVARVLGAIRGALSGTAEEVEVTLEANPEDASAPRLRDLAAAGVNRLSLGVQGFDDRVLARLGRRHTGAEAMAALEAGLGAGFASVGVDLIYAVPDMGLDGWSRTLEAAAATGVPHVSTYNLTVEEGTRFGVEARRGRLSMPPNDVQLAMYREAVRCLGGAGLRRYEASNFARAGHESRHNGLYWAGEAYLGLGPGACSYLPVGIGGRRWQAVRNPERYMRGALHHEGAAVEVEEEELDAEQTLVERLLMGLRVAEGLDLRALSERLELDLWGRIRERALALSAAGLLDVSPGGARIRATERGTEVLDSVVDALS
jgi:oxygen-independent coproporphyrinogen-3 oxidase